MVREEEVVRRWSGSGGGGRLTSTSGTGDDDEAPTRPLLRGLIFINIFQDTAIKVKTVAEMA